MKEQFCDYATEHTAFILKSVIFCKPLKKNSQDPRESFNELLKHRQIKKEFNMI